jgi:hypothetical protein
VIAPGLARLIRLFENHMVRGQLLQIVADGKASLPSTDDGNSATSTAAQSSSRARDEWEVVALRAD